MLCSRFVSDEGQDIVLPRGIRIPFDELLIETSRGGGPGGQNVNKVSSKVRVRFNVRTSPSLPEEVRLRLLEKLASKLTTDGELLVAANEYRDQPRNRAAALERLRRHLDDALFEHRTRRKTKPTRGSIERRIGERKHRSDIKKMRRGPEVE
jgi:ribosome-associated protein